MIQGVRFLREAQDIIGRDFVNDIVWRPKALSCVYHNSSRSFHLLDMSFDELDLLLVKAIFGVKLTVNLGYGFRPVNI